MAASKVFIVAAVVSHFSPSMNQPRMGIAPTSAGAWLLLAALLMSATLDCARKQGKQHIYINTDVQIRYDFKVAECSVCCIYLDHSIGNIYIIVML